MLGEIMALNANLRVESDNFVSTAKLINLRKTELGTSFRERTAGWNITVAEWLRTCFYEPLVDNGLASKDVATLLTFAVSGFWHGVSFSFYGIFFYAFLCITAEKILYRDPLLRKYFYWTFLNRIFIEWQFAFFHEIRLEKWIRFVKLYPEFFWSIIVYFIFANCARAVSNLLKKKAKST